MAELILDLTKSFELNLEKAGVLNIPTMEVRLAVDKSGSMNGLYRQGFVDHITDLFLAVGLKFDDNGSVEVGFFNNTFHEAPEATQSDIGSYMRKARESADGGTNFAPIIEAFELDRKTTVTEKAKGFFGRMFGKTTTTSTGGAGTAVEGMRAYAGIVTDGDNFDQSDFEQALAQTSGEVFYQFIGIGNGVNERYLTRIANRYKHVSFIHIEDPMNFTYDSFYAKLCNEKLANWINGQ